MPLPRSKTFLDEASGTGRQTGSDVQRVKIGLIAGLIAVAFTTAVNVISRALGLLPEALDMKYMAEVFIDPARDPASAFVLGVLIHIASGTLIGIAYALLVRSFTPVSGMIFMVATWLLMMLVLFPLTHRGFFGLSQGPVMPVATFVLNMVYGSAIGLMAGRMRSAEERMAHGRNPLP